MTPVKQWQNAIMRAKNDNNAIRTPPHAEDSMVIGGPEVFEARAEIYFLFWQNYNLSKTILGTFDLLSIANGSNLLLYRIDEWQVIGDTHGHDYRHRK